ncbi:MAG: DNA mismatch repair protein MutS [Myxococcales bacterium]|nr:DNA mismatch repair protein MutS [Myxococcales bacterium]MCB9708550.1 DNA mismatch repair protein MutS [Myxococcales bacterium]
MPVRPPSVDPSTSIDRHTPVMQQYLRCKAQYPEAIVFFRLGDFYEMFFEDAERASRMLSLTLTSRGKDRQGDNIPMAGVPHHAAASYITKLLHLGQQVALCEQMADPSSVKGVVPREVVRVITPGLVLEESSLDARAHNYFVAISKSAQGFGLAVLEMSTAELYVGELRSGAEVLGELGRLQPQEILLQADSLADEVAEALRTMLPTCVLQRAQGDSGDAHAQNMIAEWLNRESSTMTQDDLGEAGQRAMRLALRYVADHHISTLHAKFRLQRYDVSAHLGLDMAAVRNLELTATLGGERVGSLLALLDKTCSSMGARLLRRDVLAPMTDAALIRRRHDAIEALMIDGTLRKGVRDAMVRLPDLERLLTRIESGMANPRDLASLREGLRTTRKIDGLLQGEDHAPARDVLPAIALERDELWVLERLERMLVEDPPLAVGSGDIIAQGAHGRVDELRSLSSSSKDVLLALEQAERTGTGIHSLRVKYTRAFGYYIEISRAKLTHVPAHYRRKQTLVGSERFTTEELDALQAEILTADEQLHAIEEELFARLRMEIALRAMGIRKLAAALAALDVSACWAELSLQNDYVRPTMDDTNELELKGSRHPVIEALGAAGSFVPNDIDLGAKSQGMAMITGPNMAGKSTIMRQVALSVIMAQSGGYVAATSARIGIVDRIFTRIGASDNVSRGESTFMVEMRETAALLRGATSKSLVLLDEIGRGTSTYDGLAIAWAVADHLAEHTRCRVLFATHYHELCKLAEHRPSRVKNYNVIVREHQGKMVFLHQLAEGAASQSYGIAVAELAGIPASVLAQAKHRLSELERPSALPRRSSKSSGEPEVNGLKRAHDSELEELRDALLKRDLDRTSPMEALIWLQEIRNRIERG